MSIKVKQGIIKSLKKIEDNTFEEEDIRLLLILIREYTESNSLIREITHFVAHTERTQGLFHKKVNCRYAKLKLTYDQFSNGNFDHLKDKIKTEEDLSNFLLGAVSVEKIESKLFNILYIDGLDDIPESHLIKYTDFTKKDAKELFDKMYVKKEGYHYLKTELAEYKGIIESGFEEKLKNTIDNIQKVIRGTIHFDPIFDQDKFNISIIKNIKDVFDKFNIVEKYIQVIKDKIDGIFLCVLTLLHDSKFIFYNKTTAKIFLCFYEEYDFNNKRNTLYDKGVLALYISSGVMNFPLIVSKLKICDYVPKETLMNAPQQHSMFKIKYINPIRINRNLQLSYDSDE